ncbi:hypothetical protein AVEN_75841-1 [Araneus ventricosus]|uniref:Integrase p58-like C-terminal domain-containing protein n=1 Tax=Araneus ventricosus TaxID=182803 RepID=A0A4Y2JJE0_ARAVE|nr:hypothetical protein AVEN_75841-1 [Araneus ventricosus]
MVYLHVPRIKRNMKKKLAKFNQGQYRVIREVNPVVFKIQRIDKPTEVQNVHANRLIKVVEREIFNRSQDNSEIAGEGQESDGRDRKSEELDNNLPPWSLLFIDSEDDEGTEGVRCDPSSSSSTPLVLIPSSQTAQTTTQAITPSPQATGTVSGCARYGLSPRNANGFVIKQ